MYACNGLLFNHESPRKENFCNKNYSRLARIDAKLEKYLYMGNLDSLRDWGHEDYVETQWLILRRQTEDM